MMSTALSENIRRLRKAADLSVSEAARKAGIHRVAWTEIEQGKNANPTTSTLSKIAGALGVTVAELFVDEDGQSVTL
ncbi:MAG: helix-turn-helix transcriptional regulator [Acidobacteria bacterium]|nr:helix-turn-helix transcriptional regulator [Acidobacteriota bacterium]